jgi:tRNA dimethylallyltransferase
VSVEPLYLAGPTGCGKTAVALALAGRLAPVEIVNADAFQAYRGLAILSAAPTPEDRSLCPHHLFGEIDPTVENDAASFAALARARIAEIGARGALPLVVGGSGLYLKAITHGLAPTPKGDPVLRAELDGLPLEALVARYRELDPDGAAETNLRNRRYVSRNLEITLLAGRPASELKREWAVPSPVLRAVCLRRERPDLASRIAARAEAMFEAGVVAEVAALPSLSATAAKAIGLAEIQALLRGELDERECRERIAQATRRYAKRQETWFRREAAFVMLDLAPDEGPEATAGRIAGSFALPKRVG